MNTTFWRYIIPLMSRIPILRKIVRKLVLNKLAKIVAISITNFNKATELSNVEEYKDNPFWQIGTRLSAMLALMPIAQIYYSILNKDENK